jgi:hypothetical protein
MDQIGKDVEVVYGRLDEQGISDLVAERAPAPVRTAVAGHSQDDVADLAEPARTESIPQRRLVLVEAVAHGDAHLLACPLHLVRDPNGCLDAVRDRLL